MLYTSVNSSNLAKVGYDSFSNTLEVKFHNGSAYRYKNVPPGIYNALLHASSKGTYFNYNIKNRYPYSRVG